MYALFQPVISKKCNYKTSILLQYKWEMSSLLFWYQPRFIQHYFLAKVKPRQHASNYTLSSLICTVTQCYHSDMITYFLPHSHTHYFSFSASFHQLQSLQLLFFTHRLFICITPSECQAALQVWCTAANLDSQCRESTRPKDKPARHIKPAALIIQSGDGCLLQINVFYNSTLAFHYDWSRRGGGRGSWAAQLAINMHFRTKPPK